MRRVRVEIERMAAVVAKAADMQAELEGDIDRLIELQKEIVEVIEMLSDSRHREVLILRYVESMSYAEIANMMNYDPSWVWRMHEEALKEIDRDGIIPSL